MFDSVRKLLGACVGASLVLSCSLAPTAGAAGSMLVDPVRLASLPTSGAPYASMKQTADNALATMDVTAPASSASPWLPNYGDSSTGVGKGAATLAAALVYARTGDTRYRDFVIRANRFVIGSEDSASTNGTGDQDKVLATMRQISAYVMAADLVGMDPNATGSRSGYTSTVWSTWLRALRTKSIGSGNCTSIVACNMKATNWGAWASASRVAIDVYLKDSADLAIVVGRLKLYLGESAIGTAWIKSGSYDATWACAPAGVTFVAVNPSSCGQDKDGVISEDASRSASAFPKWDKTGIDYSFHAYGAQLVAALLLNRQGYDVWNWGDRALKRVMDRLNRLGVATGNGRATATHVSWIPRHFYGQPYPTLAAKPGDTLGYTDWLYGTPAAPPAPPAPSVVTLGNATAGPVWTAMSADRKRASRFTLASTSTFTSIQARIDGRGATTGTQPIRGVIYADRSGAPDTVVATSATVNVAAGQASAQMTLKFGSPKHLTSGTYWVGLHSGGTTAVARYAATTASGALRFNNAADAFADGSASPFGAVAADDKRMSIAAIGTLG